MATAIEDGVFLWQKQAKCSGYNNDTFFSDEEKAKEVCATCPVKGDCLQDALLYNYSGVWGGTTDKERRNMPAINRECLIEDYKESGMYNQRLKV